MNRYATRIGCSRADGSVTLEATSIVDSDARMMQHLDAGTSRKCEGGEFPDAGNKHNGKFLVHDRLQEGHEYMHRKVLVIASSWAPNCRD